MSPRAKRRHSLGFSLIEVLIAVVILSFGLLALAALQGALFKASAESKAQSVGLSLAIEKLEYFRGFKSLEDYQAFDTGTDAASEIGGVSYTRSWKIERYAYPAVPVAGDDFKPITPNTGPLGATYAVNNEFKRIEVKVSWTDALGTTQSVSLEDAIAALDPGDSRKVGKPTSGGRSRGPLVRIYDPTTEEGVIPIAIGEDTDTAATNPKPIVNSAGTAAIETRFDVFTYANADGKTATAQSRVETALMACECVYGANSATAKRPTYWDGTHYVEPENSKFASPASAATSKGGGKNKVEQSDLCTICCRDHHDPGGVVGAKFDPRDPTHVNGHSLLGVSTRSTSGSYAEVCRVIRVNGFYRVAADTYNDYSNLLPTYSLQSPVNPDKVQYLPIDEVDQPVVKNYQNFVKDYLVARNVTPSANYNNKPTGVGTLETLHDMARPYTPIQIKPLDTDRWLHMRGLYVDYLEDQAVQAIADAKKNCPDTGQIANCVLQVLPFTSINLTELADWSPRSTGAISVTRGQFYTALVEPKPIRGKVTANNSWDHDADAKTPNVPVTNGQKVDGVASVRSSNSGLVTLDESIDNVVVDAPQNWPDSLAVTDKQGFQFYGAGTSTGGTFSVSLRHADANPDAVLAPFATNFQIGVNDTALPSGICNPIGDGEFGCDAAFLPASHTLTVINYNYHSDNTVDAATTPLPCEGPSGSTAISYPGSSYQTLTCHTYLVTKVTPTGTITPNLTGEKARTSVTPATAIANGNSIVIEFTAQPDTLASPTCTYEGEGTSINDFDVIPAACP